VRTVLLYGGKVPGGRPNFVQWVKDKLSAGERIKVVDDQFRTPTYVEDLAKGIILVLIKQAKGIYHISGKEMCTPYQLAVTVANLLQLDESLIEKVTAECIKSDYGTEFHGYLPEGIFLVLLTGLF